MPAPKGNQYAIGDNIAFLYNCAECGLLARRKYCDFCLDLFAYWSEMEQLEKQGDQVAIDALRSVDKMFPKNPKDNRDARYN